MADHLRKSLQKVILIEHRPNLLKNCLQSCFKVYQSKDQPDLRVLPRQLPDYTMQDLTDNNHPPVKTAL